jgi:hypothetical protein
MLFLSIAHTEHDSNFTSETKSIVVVVFSQGASACCHQDLALANATQSLLFSPKTPNFGDHHGHFTQHGDDFSLGLLSFSFIMGEWERLTDTRNQGGDDSARS